MSTRVSTGIFNASDLIQMKALDFRDKRNNVLTSNIANAETPGYRALGYDFEKQLQSVAGNEDSLPLKVSHPKHLKSALVTGDGQMRPEVFVRPNESVGEDGNTVDLDLEMADLAKNQIQFRSTVETLNRKMGILRYAIQGGR